MLIRCALIAVSCVPLLAGCGGASSEAAAPDNLASAHDAAAPGPVDTKDAIEQLQAQNGEQAYKIISLEAQVRQLTRTVDDIDRRTSE